MNKYKEELKYKREDEQIKKLKNKSIGHRLLLGKELDNQEKAYILALCVIYSTAVKSAFVMNVQKALLKTKTAISCIGV